MLDGARRHPGTLLAVAVLAGLAAVPSAAQEPRPSIARFHVEASRAEQLDPPSDMAPHGWGLDAGFALGRSIAFRFDLGLEFYPDAPPSYIAYPGVRSTGGGDWTVTSFELGAGFSYPIGPVDAFGELGGGLAYLLGQYPSFIEESTGAVVVPGREHRWTGLMSEWGLGVRTRRAGKRFDVYAGIRRRSYLQPYEGSNDGTAFQVRLGILTR